jgi:hypothetical protein
MLKQINKRAISLMLSYVILVSLAIFLGIAVYGWLKLQANVSPKIDCEQGTTLILEDYQCISAGENTIKFTLRNNGRFSIKGVIVSVGNDRGKVPINYLDPAGIGRTTPGSYEFTNLLLPGDSEVAEFSPKIGGIPVKFHNITVIQIQPFIVDKEFNKIICEESITKEFIANGSCMTR